ncbi:MAG: glutamate--tRNA ligase [Rhodospirillales bacterium]|nr:glutamate--tRNA ligase [Rhodospirillales bacterium]
MSVVTRFAPSPTGFLHIGGARTALFNWLFAHHHGGRFLLRIEDTDLARSTEEAVDAIINGLKWLDITWDGDAVSQRSRMERHAQAARRLIDEGNAYHCYASPEELAEMREAARREGRSPVYDGRWRDRSPSEAPAGVRPVVRLKAPREGDTRIDDLVQGEVTVANRQLDDMVLLRADGTPTYMLAVVVDDHDMDITHVIRGDDHLNNAFRQLQLYRALGWEPPLFAHIPLIHGADGARLSKRHGSLGIEAYRDQGILPEAMCNYLLRLGWGHGDDEIIDREQATSWFDLDGVGRAPARFDVSKLLNVNAHYLRACDDKTLADLVSDRLRRSIPAPLAPDADARILKGMASLKLRAKTVAELSEMAHFYALDRPLPISPEAATLLTDDTKGLLRDLTQDLRNHTQWDGPSLESEVREFAGTRQPKARKLGEVAQPLRVALTGSKVSPPIFEVMEILGREETLARLTDVFE